MDMAASSNVINLSDPTHNDKMQYLVDIIDSYMRWFYNIYGQDISGNGKRAQQTVDEVNGHTSLSFILPNDMLAHRQAWVKDMKAKGYLPEDAEIDFSAAFKVEQIKYQNEADINNDGILDNADINIEETETETETETSEKEGEEDNETVNTD